MVNDDLANGESSGLVKMNHQFCGPSSSMPHDDLFEDSSRAQR